MKELSLFICILSTFISFSLKAEDTCSTADLNAIPNSPFSKIPIYDQDGAGLCYAYAAAQMIDYYRFKNGDQGNDLTNPIYASWVAYYEKRNFFLKSMDLVGGDSDVVISALKSNGVCTNQEVEKKILSLNKSTNLTSPQLLFFLDTIYKYRKYFFTWDHTVSEFNKHVDSKLSCQQSLDLKNEFERLGILSSAPSLVLDNLFKNCKKHKLDVPELETHHMGDDKQMKNIIDTELEKNMPIQIDMCGHFLQETTPTSYRGRIDVQIFKPREMSRWFGCGPHAVIISGRMKINGECHYQVRNSWGSLRYPPHATSCGCRTKNGSYKAICDKGEGIEYTGCWYRAKDLIPNIEGANVFK